jgi:hypothetical protein
VSCKPISDCGIIGDMHSAAVAGLDGLVDWPCMPRAGYTHRVGEPRFAPDRFVAEKGRARHVLASPTNLTVQSDAATGGFTLPREELRASGPSGKKEVP